MWRPTGLYQRPPVPGVPGDRKIDRFANGLRPLPVSPENERHCPQTWFDPILRERAARFPGVTLRHRTQLESFTSDADGVHFEPQEHQKLGERVAQLVREALSHA